MLITTKLDLSRAFALTDVLLKKIPYATNNALTRTANELVEAERANLSSKFQIRKNFILSRVRIVKYSRANDLWTRVAIDSNVQGGQLLLAFFESGGEKVSELGPDVAVPLTGEAARPSFAQKVQPSLLYRALNMRRTTTSGGKVQFKGDRRTFVIAGVGIFQRLSSGSQKKRAKGQRSFGFVKRESGAIALIYSFRPGVPLDARLSFVTIARELVAKRFSGIWCEEFAREISGRRVR